MKQVCTDRVVGAILAGWRYDISGIAPEMAGDYEQHFRDCAACRSRQRLHRTIDVALIFLTTASALVFLLAFGAIHHFEPRHAFVLELIALAGFAMSALIWLAVAVATPAPLVMADAARTAASNLHDRLPERVRDRIPEELRLKISGQS